MTMYVALLDTVSVLLRLSSSKRVSWNCPNFVCRVQSSN